MEDLCIVEGKVGSSFHSSGVSWIYIGCVYRVQNNVRSLDNVKSNMGFCPGNSLDGGTFYPTVFPCNKDFNSELISGFWYSCISFPALSSRLYCACFIKRGEWFMRYDMMYLCLSKNGLCLDKKFFCLVFNKKMWHGKWPFVKEFFSLPSMYKFEFVSWNLPSLTYHATILQDYGYFLLLSFNFAFSSSCHGSCMWILCVLVMMEI